MTEFLQELQASGAARRRSVRMRWTCLRWFRFLWAVEVAWGQATRCEARDFCRWLALVDKPRTGTGLAAVAGGAANPVTGKRSPGSKYAASTLAHSETVLRSFYAFHLRGRVRSDREPVPAGRGSGPGLGRMPITTRWSRSRRNARAGIGPRVAQRIPRRIPDERFNQVFAQLRSDRDRALVAFWVSTGARAAELLGARGGDVDPGQQLITVVRKGSRAVQQLPASADAFVWLRLYQVSLGAAVAAGADDPLWWTNRKPLRPLTYHAARAMFTRANQALGANWSLHDLRHTAAYRMARDPQMPLCDVQWVLGHVHLSTTQLYLTPAAGRGDRRGPGPPPTPPRGRRRRPAAGARRGSGYRAESLGDVVR